MMFKSGDDLVLLYIALKPIRNKRFCINFVSSSLLINLMFFFVFFYKKWLSFTSIFSIAESPTFGVLDSLNVLLSYFD